MADQQLRALEREAATGDPAAAARHLVARVRAGELAQELLELAAFAGDDPARVALTGDARTGWMPWRISTDFGRERGYAEDAYQWHVLDAVSLDDWLRAFERHFVDVGPVRGWVLHRASVSAALLAQPAWEAWQDSLTPTGRRRASEAQAQAAKAPVWRVLERAKAWLAQPNETQRVLWSRLWAPSNFPFPSWVPWPDDPSLVMGSGHRVLMAAEVVGELPVRHVVRSTLAAWALR